MIVFCGVDASLIGELLIVFNNNCVVGRADNGADGGVNGLVYTASPFVNRKFVMHPL